MNAMPRCRGWCPSLYDPMETGDGLLVRVKPPGARLTAPTARLLADAAARWGNGVIELTRRGNLQVRGLRPDGVAPFAAAMAAAGLADPDPARERRRVVIAPPLAGDDPGAAATGLAERIEAALADGPALASKFCIAVDACGVLAGRTVPADIQVRTGGAEDRIIAGSLDATCAPDRTVAEVLRLAILADGKRLVPLSLRERAGVRGSSGAVLTKAGTCSAGTHGSPLRSQDPLTPALSRWATAFTHRVPIAAGVGSATKERSSEQQLTRSAAATVLNMTRTASRCFCFTGERCVNAVARREREKQAGPRRERRL